MSLLMYGTRDQSDLCYYPRSGKVFFRGIGLVTRLGDQLDYGTARTDSRRVGYRGPR